MSIYGYKKKGRPALWTQIQNERGEVTHALNVRSVIRQQEREAKRNDEFRRRRIAAAKQQRERQQAGPAKRIPYASKSRARELAAYRKARTDYLKTCPFCEVCVQIDHLTGGDGTGIKREHLANDIHHVRGRAGQLLTDKRHFKAVCRGAHLWIHAQPSLARALGLLAQPGQWNRHEP